MDGWAKVLQTPELLDTASLIAWGEHPTVLRAVWQENLQVYKPLGVLTKQVPWVFPFYFKNIKVHAEFHKWNFRPSIKWLEK